MSNVLSPHRSMFCVMLDHHMCNRVTRWYDSEWVCTCVCHEVES